MGKIRFDGAGSVESGKNAQTAMMSDPESLRLAAVPNAALEVLHVEQACEALISISKFG
jgi:hypothetical protein